MAIMPIERISLRALAVGVVLALGLLSGLLLGFAALTVKSAAFESQKKSLARVIEVASVEVIRQLDQRVFGLGTSLQARDEFRVALDRKLADGEGAPLQAVLRDPFVHGFVDAGQLDLVKLRVYDAALAPLGENDSKARLPSGLPPVLQTQAAARTGVERLKALGALWLGPTGPLYSVLLPVGGLRVRGYLEVVVDPSFNLTAVARMTRMPMTLLGADGRVLHSSASPEKPEAEMLAVDYVLPAADGQPAFHLICLDDVTQLRDDVRHTTFILLAGTGLLVCVFLLFAIAFFNRFLFGPVRGLQADMERCAGGDLSATIDRPMLKEFRVLAESFNLMARQLAGKIEELRLLSCTDGLTALSNRHHFDLALVLEWSRARRTQNLLSLIILDVDHFKLYNDHYGHPAGDTCLKVVGQLLNRAVRRPTDIAARYGGEEFAILLPDTDSAGARCIAEAFMSDLAKARLPHAASPTSQRVTVSIGIASCRAADDCDADKLLAAADDALYRAKHAGRNRIES